MLSLFGSYPWALLCLRAPVGKYKIAPLRIKPALFKQMVQKSSAMAEFCYQSYPAPTFQPLSCPKPEQQSWGESQGTFQTGSAWVKDWNRGLETLQIVPHNKCEFSCQVTNITVVFMKYRVMFVTWHKNIRSTLSFHQSVFKGSG